MKMLRRVANEQVRNDLKILLLHFLMMSLERIPSFGTGEREAFSTVR
jgi:hypothetical protein